MFGRASRPIRLLGGPASAASARSQMRMVGAVLAAGLIVPWVLGVWLVLPVEAATPSCVDDQGRGQLDGCAVRPVSLGGAHRRHLRRGPLDACQVALPQ
jgi:hypothetical protein